MDKKENVLEQLKALIEEYDFCKETLARYLSLTVSQIEELAQGKMDFLPEESDYRFKLFNKISFLYLSAVENKDLKLSAFLEVLISQHGLSEVTIAKMAGVEKEDIEKILAWPPKKVSEEVRYKVAVTVMSLRFFLKECEASL